VYLLQSWRDFVTQKEPMTYSLISKISQYYAPIMNITEDMLCENKESALEETIECSVILRYSYS